MDGRLSEEQSLVMMAHSFQPSLTIASLHLSICTEVSRTFMLHGLKEEMERKGSIPRMIGSCRGAMCLSLCLCSCPFRDLGPCNLHCAVYTGLRILHTQSRHCRDTGPGDTGPGEGCEPLRAWLTCASQMQQLACVTEGPISCPLLSPPKWPLA